MPMVKDYLHNNFKHGIEAGKLQYGVGQETTSAEVAEILATADIDWLFVDGEHGGHTVTPIILIAPLMRFAFCRRLKAFAVGKIWRLSRTRPASAQFFSVRLICPSTWGMA